MESRKYRLLLFDLDDTLLNSSWFENGIIQTLGLHPLSVTLDKNKFLEHMLHVPQSLLDMFKEGELTTREFIRARWRSAFSHFDVSPKTELIDEIDLSFIHTSMSFISVDEMLISLFNELRKRYKLGIVTNGIYDPKLKIKQMGLSHVFNDNTIFHSEQYGFRKPDSEIYSIALDHFEKEASETIFIGDSWVHDVVAPMEMGMGAIWVNAKKLAPNSTHIPIAVVAEIKEIQKLLF